MFAGVMSSEVRGGHVISWQVIHRLGLPQVCLSNLGELHCESQQLSIVLHAMHGASASQTLGSLTG